jgi:hypothetical protein
VNRLLSVASFFFKKKRETRRRRGKDLTERENSMCLLCMRLFGVLCAIPFASETALFDALDLAGPQNCPAAIK